MTYKKKFVKHLASLFHSCSPFFAKKQCFVKYCQCCMTLYLNRDRMILTCGRVCANSGIIRLLVIIRPGFIISSDGFSSCVLSASTSHSGFHTKRIFCQNWL